MKSELLNKYFNDQCTVDELEEVLAWFQTDEGLEYLGKDINDSQEELLSNGDDLFLFKEINSEKLFSRIQLGKKKKAFKKRHRAYLRVASILLLVGLFSFSMYFINSDSSNIIEEPKEVALISYTTQEGQRKVFTLSDGTKIRLNEKSTLIVPEVMSESERIVNLKGEAYFEVVKNKPQSFIVQAGDASIVVLGTKFNVKANTVADNVQVAVVEGKVALKGKEGEHSVSALLTQNDFGLLQLSSNSITIEKARVTNYLSWMNRRLVYSGEKLQQVSQQLEYLYNVEIDFETENLKNLELTADFEKSDLKTTIATIAKTFDIQYGIQGQKVTWKE
ncbi:MAG: FecR family protein [Balneolaceae bacterium]